VSTWCTPDGVVPSPAQCEPLMSTNPPDSLGARFDADGDWIAREFFSPADLQLSPEEYAARHAHRWGCFSFHLYRYQDPVLGAWVRRVGELLFNETELELCRQAFLTPEERATVHREQAEGF
jgi:hypothetical protein